MEYTVSQLAKLSGVSSRTLRYYDQIDLLKPAKISTSGYRIYSKKEVDLLQQILFYRELDVGLKEIRQIIKDSDFDVLNTLNAHYKALTDERTRLDEIIKTVEKTILNHKGEIDMSDQEKFEGFKKDLINKNEAEFGSEIRAKYGDTTIDESNAKLMGMSEDDYEAFRNLEQEIIELLKTAIQTNDPASEAAKLLASKHKEWLSFSWPSYSKEAHRGLVEMYVQDERFKHYYNQHVDQGAEFLRDAVLEYTK